MSIAPYIRLTSLTSTEVVGGLTPRELSDAARTYRRKESS